MILDRSGTVRYCHADAARLFHASPQALVGQHVRELISDLPFDRRTPGYNVAYATFWAPEGPPQAFSVVDAQGRSFGVQVALDRLELEKQILLGLRLEVARKGVTVNTISPGYIGTKMVMAIPKEILESKIIPQIPVGRQGTPEGVAGLIIYLCSEEAAFVTGANIAINGGQHMQ